LTEAESFMDAVEALEAVLTLDQAERLAEFDRTPDAHEVSSTQQLLDELLGRFEEDDSPTLRARGLMSEFYADSDQ